MSTWSIFWRIIIFANFMLDKRVSKSLFPKSFIQFDHPVYMCSSSPNLLPRFLQKVNSINASVINLHII